MKRFAALANAVIDQLEPVQHDDVLDDQQVWLKFYILTMSIVEMTHRLQENVLQMHQVIQHVEWFASGPVALPETNTYLFEGAVILKLTSQRKPVYE